MFVLRCSMVTVNLMLSPSALSIFCIVLACQQLPLYQQQAILQHQAAKQLNMKYLQQQQQQQQQQNMLKAVMSQAPPGATHQTPVIVKSPALAPPQALNNLQATSPFMSAAAPRAPSPISELPCFLVWSHNAAGNHVSRRLQL